MWWWWWWAAYGADPVEAVVADSALPALDAPIPTDPRSSSGRLPGAARVVVVQDPDPNALEVRLHVDRGFFRTARRCGHRPPRRARRHLRQSGVRRPRRDGPRLRVCSVRERVHGVRSHGVPSQLVARGGRRSARDPGPAVVRLGAPVQSAGVRRPVRGRAVDRGGGAAAARHAPESGGPGAAAGAHRRAGHGRLDGGAARSDRRVDRRRRPPVLSGSVSVAPGHAGVRDGAGGRRHRAAGAGRVSERPAARHPRCCCTSAVGGVGRPGGGC